MATISIKGLYDIHPEIFQYFQLPDDVTMSRDIFINTIIVECAELELLYPDPNIMENLINLWTAAELPNWTRYYAALAHEYDPLWNVDATISETVTRSDTKSGSDDSTRTDDLNSSSTRTLAGTVDDTDTLSSTAFNVAEFRQRDKNVSALESGENENVSIDNTGTVTDSKDWSETGSGTETHSIRRTGNIGVTTSQQMLQQEMEIAKEFNFVYYVVGSFKRRFCLLVY